MFDLYFRPKASKTLKNVERKIQLKINCALDDIKLGRFGSRDIKNIEGTNFGYRLRIGRWRILFTFLKKERKIEIVDIFLKKSRDDYKKRKHLLI
ncbi:MAG: hypothetical protein ABIG08_03205 [bacterium]